MMLVDMLVGTTFLVLAGVLVSEAAYYLTEMTKMGQAIVGAAIVVVVGVVFLLFLRPYL